MVNAIVIKEECANITIQTVYCKATDKYFFAPDQELKITEYGIKRVDLYNKL